MNKILFFAHLRDVAGKESIELELDGKTVSEIKQLMSQQYEGMVLDNVMTAVNEEFSNDDDVIKKGDIIAFIPPVSGG